MLSWLVFLSLWSTPQLKATLEGKVSFQLTTLRPWSCTGESQSKRAEIWRQDLKRSPWRSAASWLAPHDSAWFLTPSRTTCLGEGGGIAPPTVNWAFSHPIISQENALQSCLWANFMEAFFFSTEAPSQMTLAYSKLIKRKLVSTHILGTETLTHWHA